jgi:hypothetical protein
MHAIRRFIVLGAFVFSLCTAMVAQANVDCVGVPTNVLTWGNTYGTIAVTLQGFSGTWLLCSVDSTTGNITPDHCKAILAMLLQALAGQRTVDIQFTYYTDCTAVPTWSVNLPPYLNFVIAY